jgi:hypothetical protein
MMVEDEDVRLFSHPTLTFLAFDTRNSPAIIGVNTAMPGSALAGRAS